eukprot:c16211_g1_i3 orf=97-789(+)
MGRLQDELETSMDIISIAGSESSASGADKATPRVLSALARTINRLVSRNEKCIDAFSTCRTATLYHGTRTPGISIGKYLQRINRYTCCSPSCFVVGFIYIDQLVHKQPDFPLILLNIHRLLLISIMVATKFLDDMHYNNAFYAKVGGISVHELNYLEIDFLFKLNFHVHVTPITFEGYCTHLERELLSSVGGHQIEKPLTDCCFSADLQQEEKLSPMQDSHIRLLKTHRY